jgi:hypothetical protein
METRTVAITRAATGITVVEGVVLPDFEQLEREAREEKEQTLEHLRDVACTAQRARTAYVTLAEVAEIVGVHKSNVRKMVRKRGLGHSYGRMADSSQKQMIFTKEEAEVIIQEYFGG